MKQVQDILRDKGTQVYTIQPRATIQQAAILMNEHQVGALVVSEQGRVQGILTERDLLRRVVAPRMDPATTLVQDVMTLEVICCEPVTTLDEVRWVFSKRRIRHLPVVEADGRLMGMVSLGDLNAHQAMSQEQTIHYLHEYLYGSPPV